MVDKGQILGVFTLGFEQIRKFTSEDQDFVLTLAQQGSQALGRAHLYRQMQRALSELQMTYDQSAIGMIQLDTDLRYVRVNNTLALMNGIPAAEHIKKTIWEIVPDLAPKIEERMRKVMQSGEPAYNIEVVGETQAEPGVPHTWLESWYPLRNEDSTVVGLNIVVQDITERKQMEEAMLESERKFSLIYNKLPFAAALSRPEDGYIVDVNEAFERIFGYSREQAIGKNSFELGINPDLEGRTRILSALQMQGSVRNIEIELFTKREGARIFLLNLDTVSIAGNKYILQTAQDITERKRAEDALRESEKRLQILNESLEHKVREQTAEVRKLASDLTKAEQRERYRIAHILHDDLQQRLHAIRMQMDFLLGEMEKDNETVKRDVDEVRRQFKEVVGITRSLSVDLSPPILHDEGLRQAVEWLAAQMREKYGLRIELRANGSFIIPDEDIHMLLFSCVRELLFNVVKHAGVDRAVVELKQSNGNVRVEVRDEGKGFDMAMLARLAKDQGSEDESQPRSFGLPTIRHRLNLFGGQMYIKSEPGAGTLVTLTVPIHI